MTIKQTALSNGLRIITADIADARSLTANIVIGTGSRHEDFAQNGGVSHFLEHLLFKGSKKYPTAHIIAEAVDSVGGYNNAYTSEDVTSYYIKVPAVHGELAIDILCDMMRSPIFDAEEIDRERGVIVEEMNVFHDDPARNIGTLIPQLIFPDNPLGHDIIGSEAVINTIKPEAIANYHGRHYYPGNLVVAVAGKVDHEAVVKQVEAALGDMKPGDVDLIKPVGTHLASDLAVTRVKATAQAHFIVACRALPYNHPDDRATKVLAAVLGRGMSSRLFDIVREQQGLAYNVYSDVNNYVDTGILSTYAGVNLEKINQALDSILHELERIRHEDVSAAELNKAKQQMIAGLEMSLESNSAIADRLGVQLTLTGACKSVDEVIAEINAVTVADVRRIAKQLLAPQNLRLSIIAPEPEKAAEHFAAYITSKTKE